MNYTINPFQQLYFSDDTQSEDFVELFSTVPIESAINPVFQGGNVVLSGTQGCGKTMILNLLRPETRIAYAKANKEFPVKKEHRDFISAGVNLTRSAITELVQITLGGGDEIEERELPLYFADFFNYWVVDDLLKSVLTIGQSPNVFGSLVNLSYLPQFVEILADQDCWFDALRGITNIEELRTSISERIKIYRTWVGGNFPDPGAPPALRNSKTNISEPIARTAECLRQSRVIASDVPVLIRIDQIEELHRTFSSRQQKLFLGFRKILNRAFANRDNRVHYRAGTRKYGWETPEYLSVWGSEARLEDRRDYLWIDMDRELFRLGEKKNSIFERFAEDVFQKRVQYYYRNEKKRIPNNLAKIVFGKHPLAEERLKELKEHPDDDKKIDRALGLDLAREAREWTPEWRDYLHRLYRSNRLGMLDAVLAAAWGRQTGGGGFKQQHRENPPPKDFEDAPWRTRRWWRKERLDQAVLQLLTRSQQRFIWWGYKDILSLSGGNITVFLHICHRIWDGFLKSQTSLPVDRQINLLEQGEIPYQIQADGILFASNDWFKKLPEEPGGDSRQRFVAELGSWLNQRMLADLSMSYPGGNGISIANREFASEELWVSSLEKFLKDAVGYGVLIEIEHTSKSKKDGLRLKYHLNPILCPRYQIPEARTKEPYYEKLSQLHRLALQANITLLGVPPSEVKVNYSNDSKQMTLLLDK
jgi:hypothetical protein